MPRPSLEGFPVSVFCWTFRTVSYFEYPCARIFPHFPSSRSFSTFQTFPEFTGTGSPCCISARQLGAATGQLPVCCVRHCDRGGATRTVHEMYRNRIPQNPPAFGSLWLVNEERAEEPSNCLPPLFETSILTRQVASKVYGCQPSATRSAQQRTTHWLQVRDQSHICGLGVCKGHPDHFPLHQPLALAKFVECCHCCGR